MSWFRSRFFGGEQTADSLLDSTQATVPAAVQTAAAHAATAQARAAALAAAPTAEQLAAALTAAQLAGAQAAQAARNVAVLQQAYAERAAAQGPSLDAAAHAAAQTPPRTPPPRARPRFSHADAELGADLQAEAELRLRAAIAAEQAEQAEQAELAAFRRRAAARTAARAAPSAAPSATPAAQGARPVLAQPIPAGECALPRAAPMSPQPPVAAATFARPPPSPLSPTRAAAAAARAHASGATIVPSHVRTHDIVVAEREALGLKYPPGFPIDIPLQPFLDEYSGDRDRAVGAAAAKARERADAAAKSLGFAIRQHERKPATTVGPRQRGVLWRWVCSCAGHPKSKPTLEERAPGEPEQRRRDRPHNGTGCPFAVWLEETDVGITQKGSDLSVNHNHDMRITTEAKAAWGPTRDNIPPAIFEEARYMQETMQPPQRVATIAKYLTDRESKASGQELTWSVKQFQNELAPDPVSVTLDSAQFLHMLQTTADQEGACVAPPAPQRTRTTHR